MIKLKELKSQWETDCAMDQTELGNEAARIAKLHSKYVFLFAEARLALRKADVDYAKTRLVKMQYWRGQLSKEELQALGWKQYLGNTPLKTEMADMLDADDTIITLKDRVEYLKTVYATLESILKSIGSRTYDVKNAIEWTKYTQGII